MKYATFLKIKELLEQDIQTWDVLSGKLDQAHTKILIKLESAENANDNERITKCKIRDIEINELHKSAVAHMIESQRALDDFVSFVLENDYIDDEKEDR